LGKLKTIAIFAMALWIGAVAAFAQEDQTFQIKDIIIEGLDQIALLPVMDQFTFAVGDTVTIEDVQNTSQRIFGMGHFKNITPIPEEDADGIILTFVLEEYPVLQGIEISGNRQYQINWDLIGLKIPFFWEIVKSDKLIEILEDNDVLPYSMINKNNLDAAVLEIQKLYQERGYTLFQIDMNNVYNSIINGDILRIPIVEYIIEEIRVEGLNEEFSEIADTMITLPNTEPVKALVLNQTLTALTESIFFVPSPNQPIEPIPGSKFDKVVLKFNLSPRILIENTINFSNIIFTGNTAYAKDRLRTNLGKWDANSPVDNLQLLHILRNVFDLYHENGYSNMTLDIKHLDDGQLEVAIDEGSVGDVSVRLNYDDGHTTVTLPMQGDIEVRHFQTDEAGQEVEVAGNLAHTKPYVLNRAVQVRPGQLFNSNSIRDTVRNMLNLGYFDDVQVGFGPKQDDNKVDLNLTVIEKKKLGSLNGALSLSDTGLVGKLTVSEKNLFGTGQDIALDYDRGIFGPARTNWSLIYTANGFFPIYKDFSVRLFQSFERPTFDDELNRTGGELTLTYPLTSNIDLTMGGRHEIFQECLRNNQECDSPGVTDSVKAGLSRDTRDSPIFPMQGGRERFQIEKAGGFSVGVEFTKIDTALIHHFFILEDQNISARLFAGWGEGMPTQEKFHLGGPGSIRGLVDKRVDTMSFLNLEYRVKWLDQFSTALFTDWGMSNRSELQGTVGLEARVAIPLVGMTRLILAWPVNDPSYTTFAPRFQFSFGEMF